MVIVADFQIANQEQKTFLKEIPLRISTRLRILDPNLQTRDVALENPWKTESSNNTGWILSLANQNETWWKGNVCDATIYGFNVQFYQHTSDQDHRRRAKSE